MKRLVLAGFALVAGCSPTVGGGSASTTPEVLFGKVTLDSRHGCLIDGDCAAGLYCAQNACTFECAGKLPCAAGETCSDHGRCIVAQSDETTGVQGLEDEALAAVVPTTQPEVRVVQGLPVELQVPPGAPFVEATLTTSAPVPAGAITYRVDGSRSGTSHQFTPVPTPYGIASSALCPCAHA